MKKVLFTVALALVAAGVSAQEPNFTMGGGFGGFGGGFGGFGGFGGQQHGFLLDQESNPGPLHWQVDSYLLCHQESPRLNLIMNGKGLSIVPYIIAY